MITEMGSGPKLIPSVYFTLLSLVQLLLAIISDPTPHARGGAGGRRLFCALRFSGLVSRPVIMTMEVVMASSTNTSVSTALPQPAAACGLVAGLVDAVLGSVASIR